MNTTFIFNATSCLYAWVDVVVFPSDELESLRRLHARVDVVERSHSISTGLTRCLRERVDVVRL